MHLTRRKFLILFVKNSIISLLKEKMTAQIFQYDTKKELNFPQNERHVLLSTVSGSNSTRYAGDIHLQILNI